LFRKGCFPIALIIMVISTHGYAGEKVLRVATLEDYAPFCMIAAGVTIAGHSVPPGEDTAGFSGYCWDVLRESFHLMGYTIQLTVTPWARAMLNLKTGEADILFPAGQNSGRLKIFDYSKEPTNQANFLIYIRADRQIQWRGLDGLRGMTIGVKRGFNYGDKWEAASGILKYEIRTIAQGFKMLSADRIDGFIGYEYNWDYHLKKENMTNQYKKLPAFDYSAEYLVALKTNPKGKLFLKDFDAGKRQLIQTGKLKKLKEKWFGNQ